MKKKTVKTTVLALMLLAVSLYFIGGTYARYASEFEGKGSVDVAQWKVALTDKSAPVEEEFTLDLTKEADDFVVANKIAPDATVSGDLGLDLNGTEVAVKVSVDVKTADLKQAAATLGINPDDITASIELIDPTSSGSVSGDATNGYTIKLPSKQAFNATNGQYTVRVKITWTNNENNAEDTKAGETPNAKLTVPVTVRVEQLTAND